MLAADRLAKEIAANVRVKLHKDRKPPKNGIFALESKGIADINKKINAAMNVSAACIGCDICAKLCPKGNIKVENGKAVIGTNCIGCMACVEYCPKEAINVGRITVKRARYHNANITPADLTRSVIHID